MRVKLDGIEKLQQYQEELGGVEASYRSRQEELTRGLASVEAEAKKEVLGNDQLTPLERIGWLYALQQQNVSQTAYAELAQSATDKLEEVHAVLGQPGVPFIFHRSVLRSFVISGGYAVGVTAGSGLHLHDTEDEWWKADIEAEENNYASHAHDRTTIGTETRHLLKAVTNIDEVEALDANLVGYEFSFVAGTENMIRLIERLADSDKDKAKAIFVDVKLAGLDLAQHSDFLAREAVFWRSEVAQSLGEQIVAQARKGVGSDSINEEILHSLTDAHRVLGVDEAAVREAALIHNDESHTIVRRAINELE